MKQSVRFAMTLCAVFAATAGHAEESRPLTALDLWKVKRVGPQSIAPDGTSCVVEVTTWDIDKDESSSNLWILSTDGTVQKQLTYGPGKNSGPKWSPDGAWIAFTSKRGEDVVPQVYVISPTGGEARRVSKMAAAPSGLKWSENSRTIYCIGWTWPDAPDDTTHAAHEKAENEQKSKAVVIDGAQFRVWDHWSSDGKRPMIFAIDVASGRHQNLLSKSKRFLPPTEPPPSAADYDVSPDGKQLCFTIDSAPDYGTDFNSDLYVLTLDDSSGIEPKNITADNPASDTSPAYSPDGKHIAFLRTTNKKLPADRHRLMLLDRDATTAKELPALVDRSCQSPRWIDAGRIAFEAENGGVKGIYFVNLEGKLAWTKPPGISEQSIDFARGKRLTGSTWSGWPPPAAATAAT